MVVTEINARGRNPNAPWQMLRNLLSFFVSYAILHATRAKEFLTVNVWEYVQQRWAYHKAVNKFFEDHAETYESDADRPLVDKVVAIVLLLLTPLTWPLKMIWKLLSGIFSAIFGGGGHGHGKH